jgi:hypothetical protein
MANSAFVYIAKAPNAIITMKKVEAFRGIPHVAIVAYVLIAEKM